MIWIHILFPRGCLGFISVGGTEMCATHAAPFLQHTLSHLHSRQLLYALILDTCESFIFSLCSFFLSEQLLRFGYCRILSIPIYTFSLKTQFKCLELFLVWKKKKLWKSSFDYMIQLKKSKEKIALFVPIVGPLDWLSYFWQMIYKSSSPVFILCKVSMAWYQVSVGNNFAPVWNVNLKIILLL